MEPESVLGWTDISGVPNFPIYRWNAERLTCLRLQLLSGRAGTQTRSSASFSAFSDYHGRVAPQGTYSIVRNPENLPVQWFLLRYLALRVMTLWILSLMGSSQQSLCYWITVRKLLLVWTLNQLWLILVLYPYPSLPMPLSTV